MSKIEKVEKQGREATSHERGPLFRIVLGLGFAAWPDVNFVPPKLVVRN
jgi:hypothetical protein